VRITVRMSFVVALFVSSVLTRNLVRAQTPIGANVDMRVIVTLHVHPEAAQHWLVDPWRVNPVNAGPSQGADVSLVFADQYLVQDAAGNPVTGGINRLLAVIVPGKHTETDETASIVVRLFSADPSVVPGPFKNAVLATIHHERTVKAANTEAAAGHEAWTVHDPASGGFVELQFDYQGDTPVRRKGEAKVYSSVDPHIWHSSHVDQGTDVLKSVPGAIDRVQNLQLTVTIPELRTLFDGSERVVSIALLPWYVRDVSLP